MTPSDRKLSWFASALVAALLTVGISACAPEPSGPGDASGAGQTDSGGDAPDDVAGKGGKGSSADGESSWSQPQNDAEVEKLTTELPADFPSDAFRVPVGSVIYDTGSPSPGSWFLVLRAAGEAEASALWDQVISEGGFIAADETETTEGGKAARLSNQSLNVLAVTVPQIDGTVLVSYDIARIG